MSDKLQEIIAYKNEVIAARKVVTSLNSLENKAENAPKPKGFINALKANADKQKPALIAELKKASPSKGLIRADFEPVTLAKAYEQGGAACLSVLTDEKYFQGHDEYLLQVLAECPLPALRKDFMVEPYQIVESRALGADCILLIMAALSDQQAKELEDAAHALGMDVLAETHDEEELERALTHLKTDLIGVNNRNLKTFETDLHTSIRLAKLVPEGKLQVCESGVFTHDDVALMQSHDIHCFLVGESLMRQGDVAKATRELLG